MVILDQRHISANDARVGRSQRHKRARLEPYFSVLCGFASILAL